MMLPQRIVALGASTFFGRVDPEGGGFIGRLKTWHEKSDRKNAVFNLGISSETSADLLNRLIPECTPRKPDLIVLGAASNDARRIGSREAQCETTLHQYETNFHELIRRGRKLAQVIVVLGHPIDETRTTPLPYKNVYYMMSDLKKYMSLSREICTAEHVPCLDVFSLWQKENYLPWICEDGLHPNAAGHQKIFEMLRDFLISLPSQNTPTSVSD